MELESGNFRCYADNVLIELEPLPTETESGIALAHVGRPDARGHRRARVIASGPGYTTRLGAFVPNETRAGDRVLVSQLAGDDWSMNLSAPRHNPKGHDWRDLMGRRGEWRMVREGEIMAVLG